MISGIMLWNEPNNLSHWDFEMDPEAGRQAPPRGRGKRLLSDAAMIDKRRSKSTMTF